MRAFALAALIAAQLSAQHIDFARHFPPLETQRSEYENAVKKVEAHRGRITKASIEDYNVALKKMERLDAYLYLQYAVDTRHVELLHDEESLGTDFEKRTAAFRRGVAKAHDLAPRYAHFVEQMRRTPIQLTLQQTEIVSRLEPITTGWPDELYDALNARKEQSRDLYAFALLGLVRARTELAHLHGFPDAASEVYARSELTRADSRRLFDAIAAESPRYVAFQKARGAPTPPGKGPTFSFDEARAILPQALAPLGPSYIAELQRLLDPANGRIDVEPGEHRKRGGFSKGFPGMTSVFYMQGFTGTYNDMRVIAHEGTHAVQRALQAQNNVPPIYASAPSFVMEALAITAELTLPRYLYEREKDPALKRLFLDQLLASKGIAILFQTAAEGDLEERIYDGVARGEIHGAEDLDALTVATYARYGIVAAPDQWTKVRLMFEDPFYDINYTWASLVALPLFGTSRTDPATFAKQYSQAIASGFDRPLKTWLEQTFHLDLRDPALVRRALDAMQPYVDALRPNA